MTHRSRPSLRQLPRRNPSGRVFSLRLRKTNQTTNIIQLSVPVESGRYA
jgi:hypothetical protein